MLLPPPRKELELEYMMSLGSDGGYVASLSVASPARLAGGAGKPRADQKVFQ